VPLADDGHFSLRSVASTLAVSCPDRGHRRDARSNPLGEADGEHEVSGSKRRAERICSGLNRTRAAVSILGFGIGAILVTLCDARSERKHERARSSKGMM
jgi:hypothetical protein